MVVRALGYTSRGWSVVRVPPRKKAPVSLEWETLRLTAEDIPGHFSPGDNVGVILGDASGGLVDIDLDCPEAIRLAPAFLLSTATFGRPGAPSSHWIYRLIPSGRTRRYQDPLTGEAIVELRANGGQTVFPGSIHESGEPIEWDDPQAEVLACHDLADRVARLAAAVLAERYTPDMPPEVDAKVRSWLGQPAAPPPPPRAFRRPTDLLERARRYLARIPGAISGAGGHNRTFRAALALVKGFDLGTGDALRLLAEDYNPRCDPPWSERELEHKVDGAAKTSVEPGYLVDRDGRSAPPPLGAAVIDLDAERARRQFWKCTDMGNAERFAALCSPEAHYVGAWDKWIVWDGRRWALDDSHRVDLFAKRTVRGIYGEAERADDPALRDQIASWARKSESAGRVAAMVGLARSEPGVSVPFTALDQEPWLLTVANGTIDLRTGQLLPHQQKHLITKLSPVAFDPSATAPRWERFLEEVQSDPHARAYLQRLAGYCATGVIREHVLPIFWGSGRNGKGVFLRALSAVLGELAVTIAPEVIMASPQDRHPTELTTLFGARLAFTSETEEGRGLGVARVKRLTGGDTIRARRMREDDWEFPPTHKLLVVTNYKPAIRETGDAIWGRVHLVPWPASFPNGDPRQDTTLDDKLAAELPGILCWVVSGCMAWQRHGLNPPSSIVAATQDYRGQSDPLAGWIADCCVESEAAQARIASLYSSYESWCGANGEAPLKGRVFGDRLAERGYPPSMGTSGTRIRRGIGLRSEYTHG